MKASSVRPVRCAIYTRVSTEHGLDQEFNSLDAQYDAASAYIKSQAHAGWTLIRSRYDDGGYSGGSTDRPDLQKLLDDIRARKIDVIVVYKVNRLTRSLLSGMHHMPQTHARPDPSLIPIERPRCPKCQARMRLARIEPGPNGSDLWTFECPKCEYVHKVMIESDPIKSDSAGWQHSEPNPPK